MKKLIQLISVVSINICYSQSPMIITSDSQSDQFYIIGEYDNFVSDSDVEKIVNKANSTFPDIFQVSVSEVKSSLMLYGYFQRTDYANGHKCGVEINDGVSLFYIKKD